MFMFAKTLWTNSKSNDNALWFIVGLQHLVAFDGWSHTSKYTSDSKECPSNHVDSMSVLQARTSSS